MFIDTNILVSARIENAPNHHPARGCLSLAMSNPERLCISRQVIREYLAVVTRPQNWMRPMALKDALQDADWMRRTLNILEDGERVTDILTNLCNTIPVAGKQIHDANIVATMLAHDEHKLLTLNVRDFSRYRERIELASCS